MRISNHGAHLVQLTRWASAFPMNCYLVVEDDGVTLVDSTMSSPAPDVAAEVARMGAELRRIVLTHAHGDHVGGVAGMRQRFPGLEIAIGEREARILAGDKSLDPGEPQGSIKGFFEKVDWRPDRLLRPGDRVGSLEVVASPGHTPGHVAFLDVRDRTLVAGDAFQTRGGMAVSGAIRPLFPFPALATWHKPTALATAITLQGLRPTRLAVGHGDLLDDPGAAIAGAVEAARKAFG
ncbi:MAG TPA: MBL fold metallo-hydrolase [Candidatus Dormibacteraeota bacterium]|nr:MBL fold metallo-hydrolase [Candidatus Dormibacteraeota bacterium]